jgi:hypothetical protein
VAAFLLALVVLPLSEAGCGSASSPASDGGVAGDDGPVAQEDQRESSGGVDAADADQGDAHSDAGGSGDSVMPVFTHEVLEFSEAAGLSACATGEFANPAHEYPAIPIEARFVHQLSFLMTPFMPPWRKSIATHGPLILYSDDFEAIVVSPLDQFFSSLVWFADGAVHLGLHGEIQSTPAGFKHRFIVVRGQGINATIQEWGRLLREDRGKTVVDRYSDLGASHLGYWTDNGAYYYYVTEEGMNEQDTLLALKADMDSAGIPIRYMQLDSWWYFKDGTAGLWPPAGLVLWEPRPELFPDGLAAFQVALGLPLVLHNRWFNKENDYLDDFDFVFEDQMALPTGQGVYDQFMEDAVSWGAITYEQDWLVTQYWGLSWLRAEPGRAETWMGNMDAAASGHGLSMQLCMEGAAHLMDSVDRASYVTVRTSTDYHVDLSKEAYWPQFHIVNMVASSLGLVPFKDNFQSSELHGEAEALVSVLSAGMVGIGDGIGKVVPDIVMRVCRSDGLLLKPDVPAVPVDGMFVPHKRPFIVSTRSKRADLGTTTYVAAFHLARKHPERTAMDRAFTLLSYGEQDVGDMFNFPDEVTDWHLDLADVGVAGKAVAYDWVEGTATLVEGSMEIPQVEHLYGFRYLVLAPILPNGLAFVGEAGKYVTVADRRFSGVETTKTGFLAHVEGVPGEKLSLLAFDATAGKLLEPVEVSIPESGKADVELNR